LEWHDVIESDLTRRYQPKSVAAVNEVGNLARTALSHTKLILEIDERVPTRHFGRF